MEVHTTESQLIVALDFRPPTKGDYVWSRAMAIETACLLKPTGVTVKLGPDIRASGYGIIPEIHKIGLPVFADLKLNDIGATLSRDGEFLQAVHPEYVTVMCSAGVEGMKLLKAELPNTKVLGVTVLSTLTDEESFKLYETGINDTVIKLAEWAVEAGLDGLVMAPAELRPARAAGIKLKIYTPGIRPAWSLFFGDDQNTKRIMTPGLAIQAGATAVIVGRPITKHSDRLKATIWTQNELRQPL